MSKCIERRILLPLIRARARGRLRIGKRAAESQRERERGETKGERENIAWSAITVVRERRERESFNGARAILPRIIGEVGYIVGVSEKGDRVDLAGGR